MTKFDLFCYGFAKLAKLSWVQMTRICDNRFVINFKERSYWRLAKGNWASSLVRLCFITCSKRELPHFLLCADVADWKKSGEKTTNKILHSFPEWFLKPNPSISAQLHCKNFSPENIISSSLVSCLLYLISMVFTVTSPNCKVKIARFYEYLFTLG